MANLLTGEQAFNQNQKEMMEPYAVIDCFGIEHYSGSYQECVDYAKDVESDRIDPQFIIIPIY